MIPQVINIYKDNMHTFRMLGCYNNMVFIFLKTLQHTEMSIVSVMSIASGICCKISQNNKDAYVQTKLSKMLILDTAV